MQDGTNPDFVYFTCSPLGTQLQQQGWHIIEKTGYYPCVFWLENLGNIYPMHLALSTVVSLIPPDSSEPITLYGFINVEVAPPPTSITDEASGIQTLHEWSPEYVAYALQVKAAAVQQLVEVLTKAAEAKLAS
jgi:hypothetical protein